MELLTQRRNQVITTVLMSLLYLQPCIASSNAASPTPIHPLHVYRSMIPLGSEVYTYVHKGEHSTFYVMASALNPEFEGEQLCANGDRRFLRTANGDVVKTYPREVHFRISVSERDGYAPLDPPTPLDIHDSTFDEFISGLQFELRIFHELDFRSVRPSSVTQIGIPLDVPANQRIYDVAFKLGEIPISDRIVIHVLTQQGDRLAKFNLDLY